MPLHRGRFFYEVESTGRKRQTFTIFLWTNEWSLDAVGNLADVETLQAYLSSLPGAPSFAVFAKGGKREPQPLLSAVDYGIDESTVSGHDLSA